jgi:hypothetical protein
VTAAAVSLVVAGLSLAAYALTAFTTRDWTVAAPSLLVAAAGVAGLRTRWLLLVGLVPIGAVLSVAAPILAFDLARPGEVAYLVGTVTVIVGSCLAAVLGTLAALRSDDRWLPLAALGGLALVPIVGIYVIGSNPASAATDGGITESERAAAPIVEMVDYAFAVDPTLLRAGEVIHLVNTGTLPHDFTVTDAAVDVAVFVPPGRDTSLRLPESNTEPFTVVCTVGDHQDLGMRLVAQFPED